MNIVAIQPRHDIAARLAATGMSWYQGPEEPTWFEHKAYVFSAAEHASLKKAGDAILDLVRPAVERMIGDERILDRLGVPADLRPFLRKTWERGDPDFYGRMDFGWDEGGNHKFYEYNADTSACLWEGLKVQPQWWLESGQHQFEPGAFHWNDLKCELARAFEQVPLPGGTIIFTSCRDNDERMKGALAMQALAKGAGYATHFCFMEDLQVSADAVRDLVGNRALTLFKVHRSWEWIMHQPLGHALARSQALYIEPFWKVLVQNKLFPAILWELAEGHPNLLETYLEDDPRAQRLGSSGYARKTVFGREGSNVELMLEGGGAEMTSGPYARAGWVRQKLHPLPKVDGRHPMMALWTVRGKCCGLIIRESAGLITRNESPVVPNVVLPERA